MGSKLTSKIYDMHKDLTEEQKEIARISVEHFGTTAATAIFNAKMFGKETLGFSEKCGEDSSGHAIYLTPDEVLEKYSKID